MPRTDKMLPTGEILVETGTGRPLGVWLSLRLKYEKGGSPERPQEIRVRGRSRLYTMRRNGKNVSI